MGKISKAQDGVKKGYYKMYKDPQVSSDYIKQLPKKDSAKKPTRASASKERPLSAKEREAAMIKELNKKGPMRPSGIEKKFKSGGKQMMKRADGSTSQRGLWDNLRKKAAQNKKTGAKPKAPTKAMLTQERKIKAKSKK